MKHKQASNYQWCKVSKQQLQDLARLRRILSQELKRLQKELKAYEHEDEAMDVKYYDSVLANVLKLSHAQTKTMATEQALMREVEEAQSVQQANAAGQKTLNEEEWQLLEAVVAKRQQATSEAGEVDGADALGESGCTTG